MQNVILILAFLAIGFILAQLPKKFPKITFEILANYIIYVALPALILVQLPNLTISTEAIAPIITPWAMLIISAVMIWLLARRFDWSRSTKGALLLVVPLGNTSFLGIPMVEAYFGSQAVPYALLYDQFGTFLALATYGTVIVAIYADSGKPATADRDEPPADSDQPAAGSDEPTVHVILKLIAKRPLFIAIRERIARHRLFIAIREFIEKHSLLFGILIRIVMFPPFIAIVLAVIIITRQWAYPEPLTNLLQDLAGTLVPIVMIAVGFKITHRIPPNLLPPLGIGLGIKLVVAPLLALAFCRAFDFDSEATHVSIFEAGMPPQIAASALALTAGLAPKLVAAMVSLGLLFAFCTLWALHLLL